MLYNRLTKQERGFDSESGEGKDRSKSAYRHGNREVLRFGGRWCKGIHSKAEGNST